MNDTTSPSMLQSLRPAVSLLCGVALLLLGTGLLNTVIPLRGNAMGFSAGLLGALTSAYFVGFLIGTFAAPVIIGRVGHIRAFALCASFCGCIVLLHALTTNPLAWLVLRLAIGIALVGLYTTIESWLNAQSEPAVRGRVFAAYMMVNLGALAVSQQLLQLGDTVPFVPFVIVAFLVCASTLPVLWTRQAQPSLQPAPRLHLRKLFAAAPSAGVGALLSGLAMGAFWGLLPVYASRTGLGREAVGTFMSAAILGGAALQFPIGRLSDRNDRRLAIMGVGLAAAALAVLLPFVPTSGMAAHAAIFLYGGAAFAVYPIVVAHLLDHLPPEDLLSASSSVLLLNGLGSAAGPLAAGFAMGAFGPPALFAWFAAMHAALALFAGYRYQAFRREQGETTMFAPMLRTTPALLDMHPGVEAADEAGTSD